MDIYFVNEQGKFTLALKQEGKDKLYATTLDEFGITKVKDWFDTPGSEAGGGITIETKGLLEQLTSYDKNAEYLMYSTTVKYNRISENDVLNMFFYLAKNIDIEFSVNFYKKNGNILITLGTYQQQNFSPGPSAYGIELSDIIKKYHNHPRSANYSDNYTERKSM